MQYNLFCEVHANISTNKGKEPSSILQIELCHACKMLLITSQTDAVVQNRQDLPCQREQGSFHSGSPL